MESYEPALGTGGYNIELHLLDVAHDKVCYIVNTNTWERKVLKNMVLHTKAILSFSHLPTLCLPEKVMLVNLFNKTGGGGEKQTCRGDNVCLDNKYSHFFGLALCSADFFPSVMEPAYLVCLASVPNPSLVYVANS